MSNAKQVQKSSGTRRKWALVLAAIAVLGLIYLVISGLDMDDRLTNWFYTVTQKEEIEKRAIHLGTYTALQQRVEIDCVGDNLSGVTYNHDSQTLFAIINDPEVIVELTPAGQCLRRIPLEGFVDTEAIAYLGRNEYAIAEEYGATISIIQITAETDRIGRGHIARSIAFEIENKANKGFEGIAYNPADESLYVVTERSPMTLFRFDGLADRGRSQFNVRVTKHDEVILSKTIMHDYSGLHFDTRSGHLLCLSHEAMLVAEVTIAGDIVGFMELETGFSGLENDVLQAEGVTIDENRHIYVVGEPNHFYVFKRDE